MSEGPPRRGLPFGLLIKGVVALLISAVAFWFAFRNVDFSDVGKHLGRSNLTVIVLFTLSQLANHLVRTWRWGLLVRPLGPVSARAIFAASSVGFPATFFLPLRLGEFVRPAMIARSGVPFPGAMASVVVERVADGLFNLGLFFLLLSLMPASAPIPDDLRVYSTLALAAFGVALAGLVVIVLMRKPAFAIIERLLNPIAPALAGRVLGLLGAFIDGLSALKSFGRLSMFLLLTAAFWIINGVTTWWLAVTYIPDLPVTAGPFAMSVVVFAILIPAGPAFLGTFEVGYVMGLAPYGVAAGPAGALALVHHATQVVMMAILVGVGFLAAEPNQRSRNQAAPRDGAPGAEVASAAAPPPAAASGPAVDAAAADVASPSSASPQPVTAESAPVTDASQTTI